MAGQNSAVLISIRPEWCRLIESGKKRIEVRKTRPSIPTPFRCFIYETKTVYVSKSRQNDLLVPVQWKSGMVIGEFTCDEIIDFWPGYAKGDDCLTFEEQEAYLGERGHGYGWHISDLLIYPKPRRLDSFLVKCRGTGNEQDPMCVSCPHLIFDNDGPMPYHRFCDTGRRTPLRKAPQSWCYFYGR